MVLPSNGDDSWHALYQPTSSLESLGPLVYMGTEKNGRERLKTNSLAFNIMADYHAVYCTVNLPRPLRWCAPLDLHMDGGSACLFRVDFSHMSTCIARIDSDQV